MIGGGLLLLLLAGVSLSSFDDPLRADLTQRLLPPGPGHPLGTDHLGHDFLVRLAAGTRVSLTLAGGALSIAGVGGAILGAIAGVTSRWGAAILAPRLYSPMMGLPLLLAVGFAILGRPSISVLMIAVGLAGIPAVAWPVRRLIAHRGKGSLGLGWGVAGGLLLVAAQGLLAEAILSHIGLGVQPPTPSLGVLLSQSSAYLRSAPHLILWPGILAGAGTASLFLAGQALTDAAGREAGE